MSQSNACCRSASKLPIANPLSQIIAIGFYDGITDGLAKCPTCGTAYRFDMLDWNEDHDLRVFRLAALPAGAFDACVAILSAVEPPSWPLWIPFVHKKPAEKIRGKMDSDLSELLSKAAPADLVAGWSAYGDEIWGLQILQPRELAGVPDWFSRESGQRHRDWFSLLGLAAAKAG